MRISKKFISLLLAVLMVTALVPMAAVSASAADYTVTTVNEMSSRLFTSSANVTLGADINVTEAIANGDTSALSYAFFPLRANVTLDLNGHTLDTGDYFLMSAGNNVIVKDTSENHTGKIISNERCYQVNVRTTFNNVSLESKSGYALIIRAGTTFNDCSIVAENNGLLSNNNVTLNNTSITAKNTAVTMESNDAPAPLVVNGSTITSTDGDAIVTSSYVTGNRADTITTTGTANLGVCIDNGSIINAANGTAVSLWAGTRPTNTGSGNAVRMTSGTINAKVAFEASMTTDYQANNDRDPIVIAVTSDNCRINATDKIFDDYSSPIMDTTNITAGYFNQDVSSTVKTGTFTENNGMYHLTEYGEGYIYNYTTLFNALNNGGNYVIPDNLTLNIGAVARTNDKEVYIDGNNKTLTLNIKDNSNSALISMRNGNNTTNITIENLTVDGNNYTPHFYFSRAGSGNDDQYLTVRNCTFKNFKTSGHGVITTHSYQHLVVDKCTFTGNTLSEPQSGNIYAEDLWLSTAAKAVITDSTFNSRVCGHIDGADGVQLNELNISNSYFNQLMLQGTGGEPTGEQAYSYRINSFENSTAREIIVGNPGTTEEDLDKILCRDATTHDNQGGMYIAKDTNGSVIDKTTTLYNDYQFRKMSDEDIVGLLGNEFKLGDDFTVSNSIGALGTSNQKNFTLDLNGKTVTITNGQGHLERRGNNNELTINDSVGGGGITTTNGYSFVLNNGMKVTVNGGNIKNTVNDVFYIYSGSADINGGDFEYPEEKSIAAGYNTSGLTVYGGTFSNNVYSFITKNTDGVFNIREANGSNTTFTTADALGYNMTQEADDTAKDWSAIPASCFKNLQMVGLQKKNAASTSTKADGNDYQTKGMRFVTLVNEGLLKSANIADYGYVVAKVSGKTQAGIGDKFANLKCDGSNGEKTISCLGSSNSLSGDYGLYDKSTTYKYVTLAVNGMRDGEQAVARFYIKTTDGKIYYADYTNDNNVVYSGMLATY